YNYAHDSATTVIYTLSLHDALPILMRDEKIVERPADQRTLTKRYTEECLTFIAAHEKEPFFLYMAHTMPHVPLFRSAEFENVSRDRKSTRLNSSHVKISYAVFCLKK